MGREHLERSLVGPFGWVEYQRWRSIFHDMLDRRFYTPEYLDGEVATGRFVLFASETGAILASIKRYPTGLLEVQGEAATGNLRELSRKLIPAINDWAKSIGCESSQIQSRPGWSRVMKDYTLYQTCLKKAL